MVVDCWAFKSRKSDKFFVATNTCTTALLFLGYHISLYGRQEIYMYFVDDSVDPVLKQSWGLFVTGKFGIVY